MQEIKMNGESLNIEQENIAKLKEIFPEVFNEDKIDFEKLQNVLGNYIDTDEEKYRFTWNGKMDALRLSQTPSTGTLRPCKEESRDWDTTQNLYIEGDNLEVLKLLQNSYLNKIKMIYIDPPYNTGNDFVYKDDFKDNITNYKKMTGQIDSDGNSTSTNKETDGRYHTNWLNMMYPRLRLARNLLTDDGVIFISIDDNEVHNLRKLCDEIYGTENFVANLIWQKKFSRSNDATYFSTMHDHILCYCKQNILNNEKGYTLGLLPRGDEVPAGYSNPDNDPRGLWTSVILSAKSGSPSLLYEITTPSGRKVIPPSGRFWSCSKETFEIWHADNRIWYGADGNGTPRKKTFLAEVQSGLRPNSILLHNEGGHNQEAKQETKELFNGVGVFDGPKPVRLLKILQTIANCNNNDIILDFFSGSATTAHAVMQLNIEDAKNRKYICIQLPEKVEQASEAYKFLTDIDKPKNICEIGKERIRRAGDKIKKEIEQENQQLKLGEEQKKLPDIGFKVFKLDSSNIRKWNPDTKDLERTLLDQVDNFVEGRKEEDALYEIILKNGLPLTVPVEELNVKGKKVYSIGMGAMIVCLDNNITLDIADEIAKISTEFEDKSMVTVVFKDNGFENDSVKTNIKETLRGYGIGKFVTV